MHKQTIKFTVKEENGIVTQIGKSAIYQPKVDSKGSRGSVKWHPDKPKMDTQGRERIG